jgi:WD40 repeat protein
MKRGTLLGGKIFKIGLFLYMIFLMGFIYGIGDPNQPQLYVNDKTRMIDQNSTENLYNLIPILSNDGTDLDEFILQTGTFLNSSRSLETPSSFQYILNSSFGTEIYNLMNHTESVSAVSFSPDGTLLVTGSADDSLKIWNVITGKEIVDSGDEGHDFNVNTLAFSPDGSLLASGSDDKSIYLWTINDKELIKINEFAKDPNDSIKSISFSPDGSIIVSGGSANKIKFWDVDSGENLYPSLDITGGDVESLAFSPDGNYLASATGGNNRSIIIWNVTDFSKISESEPRILTGHTAAVLSVDFSPDGKQLVSGGIDSKVILWNLTSNINRTWTEHTESVYSVSFSPDGHYIASGSGDNSIKLWNITSIDDSAINTFSGHVNQINAVNFSPDGTLLASGSQDTDIKVWNTGRVSNDSDGDGMGDLWEVQYGLNPQEFEDKFGDLDSDGLYNSLEYFLNTSPNNTDTDSDEMSDKWEYLWNLLLLEKDGSADFDKDGITNIYEYWHNLNPKLDDANKDKDNDGFLNIIEFHMGLNASWIGDGAIDSDKDGMSNFFEFIYGLDWTIDDANLDPDGDGMPNLYEHQMGLIPTIPDAQDDLDGDEMPNLWEYQMGLDASEPSDADSDKDNDGLSNLREYLEKTNATNYDTDGDRMGDYFEVLYNRTYYFSNGLRPTVPDSIGDNDFDGMSNFFEFQYNFNPVDDSDGSRDFDGDWISNSDEAKSGTNPTEIFSFPIFSFSIFHFLLGISIIGFSAILFLGFQYRKKKQEELIRIFGAPDYPTVIKVRKSGYPLFSAYIDAETEAKLLVESANTYFYKGNYSQAIKKYEQALASFEKLENAPLVAETVFRLSYSLYEEGNLTKESSVLKRYPSQPFEKEVISAFDFLIRALLAQIDENWGLANKAWEEASKTEDLPIEFKMISKGALLESEFRSWSSNPTETQQTDFLDRLEEWKTICIENKLHTSLCESYLLRFRVDLAMHKFFNLEKLLTECSKTAKNFNLEKYSKIAERNLDYYKKNILPILSLPEDMAEEERKKYVKQALELLDEN